jgi:hypothetical protein
MVPSNNAVKRNLDQAIKSGLINIFLVVGYMIRKEGKILAENTYCSSIAKQNRIKYIYRPLHNALNGCLPGCAGGTSSKVRFRNYCLKG